MFTFFPPIRMGGRGHYSILHQLEWEPEFIFLQLQWGKEKY